MNLDFEKKTVEKKCLEMFLKEVLNHEKISIVMEELNPEKDFIELKKLKQFFSKYKHSNINFFAIK